MAIYYINKFNEHNTDNWHFAIWEVSEEDAEMHFAGKWYKWIKRLYDPTKQFNKGYVLNPTSDIIAENEHELINKIFWAGNLKGIKAKR
jgi:hypothetical protein